jgi:hypothetical protein
MHRALRPTGVALVTVLLSGSLAATCPARAAVVWNEAVAGDLSSDPLAPTVVGFSSGVNVVSGSLSQPGGDLRDFLTFTLGPDQFLTGLVLDALVADGAGFQGINSGSASFVPDADTAGSFLGLEFVDGTSVGVDMLPALASGLFGSTGFSVPLGPGTYTYLIQEVTPGQASAYQLSFQVVPEPRVAGWLCLPLVAFVVSRRGRSVRMR